MRWATVREHHDRERFPCPSCGSQIRHRIAKMAEIFVFTCFVLVIAEVVVLSLPDGLVKTVLAVASTVFAFWFATHWGLAKAVAD